MKLNIDFVLGTFFIASCVAVDWQTASTKAGEIESLVRKAFKQSKTVAINDNQQVGNNIGKQLDDAAVKAIALLEQAETAIKNHSLTEKQSKQILNQLKTLHAGLQTDLKDELAQLSPGAAQEIRVISNTAYASVGLKSKQLFALLSNSDTTDNP